MEDTPDSRTPRSAWEIPDVDRSRGSVLRSDGRTAIGRVGAPAGKEATSGLFWFWTPDDAPVEATQIVTVRSTVGGQSVTYHALVEEVYRSSRRRGMGQEVDEHDGDLEATPEFAAEGITYASAAILRADPPYLTPPRERVEVLLATDEEARKAYGTGPGEVDNPLPVGIIRNGGNTDAGPGFIDLDYLLGANGGHLNVNGTAGLGTKSSFLLTLVYLLLAEARRQAESAPSAAGRLRVVPIVFNVKNYDLFHIDRPSRRYRPDEHGRDWAAVGIDAPGPFSDVAYYAAQEPRGAAAVGETGRSETRPFSWSLADVVEGGLLPFLFSDDDAQNDNFAALLLDLENLLTREKTHDDGTVEAKFAPRVEVATFDELLDWLRSDAGEQHLTGRRHSAATVSKLARRLMRLLYSSRGVLRRADRAGNPLDVRRADTHGPIVVDLNALSGEPGLQKFVIAAVLRQLVAARTGASAVRGLKYVVVIDELNRFAPSGGRDPITRLIETVAAEMRSQGILLFGAQQQASMVARKVVENAATRVLGQSGGLELSQPVWSLLSPAAKRKAETLLRSEKLVLQSGFRQPMHLRIPFPAWAMNPDEADPAASAADDDSLPIGG